MRRSVMTSTVSVVEPLAVETDDLTQIKGIARQREQQLNGMGIFTYAQLNAHDALHLSKRLGPLVSEATVGKWQQQARSLVV